MLPAARIFSFVGFGMVLVPSLAGDRFRVGSFAMAGCSPTALGIGLGPVVGYFANRRDRGPDAGLRRHRRHGGRRRGAFCSVSGVM